jgi:outer membrane protein OmpA-like peptidoglycan-associated protein
MKTSAIVFSTIAAIATLSAQPAAAAVQTETKQELTAISAIAVGAIAGGPIGAFAGIVAGSWLVEQVGQAGAYDDSVADLKQTKSALATSQSSLAQLEGQLKAAEAEQLRLAQLTLEQLQLEVLFRTGESQLTAAGNKRLQLLARWLQGSGGTRVAIAGFADPRGSEPANLALSKARAEQVAQALVKAGVPRSRMTVTGKGEALSQAATGDHDAYALERRVLIELQPDGQVATLD